LFDQITNSNGGAVVKRASIGFFSTVAAHGFIIFLGVLSTLWVSHKAQEDKATEVKFINPNKNNNPPPAIAKGKPRSDKSKTPKVKPKVAALVPPKEVPKPIDTDKKPEDKSAPPQEDADDEPEGDPRGVEGGDPHGVVGGVVGGTGPVDGGTSEYTKVSKAPGRVSGEKEPSIPPQLLETLRGSKGIILVKIKINTSGAVDEVEIVRSTLPLLNDVVRKHIMAFWKFDPPISGGRPVKVEFLQPFSFIF